tara:strand:+ start:63 stop:368 length:306 start_codon:yes stop_codon:yes gene_type:complete
VLSAQFFGLDSGEVVFEEIAKWRFLEELMHGVLEGDHILEMNMAIMVIGICALINIRLGLASDLLDILIAQIFQDVFEGMFDGDNFFRFGHDVLYQIMIRQ